MARPAIYSFGFLCLLTAACGGRQQPASGQAPPAAAAGSGSYEVIAVTDGGSIAGTISLSGPIPQLPSRPINKDPQVCGTGTRPSQQLMVSPSGGLKNAIVLVEGVRRGKAMPAVHAQINQSGCEYDPHVQVMPLDADISIVNSDPVLHNIHFWLGDGDLFNIAQPLKGLTNTHKIEKAGIMYAECDVHGWMKGHVAVVDNPYYAVTDDSGQFSIGDLPDSHGIRTFRQIGDREMAAVIGHGVIGIVDHGNVPFHPAVHIALGVHEAGLFDLMRIG